jgi:hypothetical protein
MQQLRGPAHRRLQLQDAASLPPLTRTHSHTCMLCDCTPRRAAPANRQQAARQRAAAASPTQAAWVWGSRRRSKSCSAHKSSKSWTRRTRRSWKVGIVGGEGQGETCARAHAHAPVHARVAVHLKRAAQPERPMCSKSRVLPGRRACVGRWCSVLLCLQHSRSLCHVRLHTVAACRAAQEAGGPEAEAAAGPGQGEPLARSCTFDVIGRQPHCKAPLGVFSPLLLGESWPNMSS